MLTQHTCSCICYTLSWSYLNNRGKFTMTISDCNTHRKDKKAMTHRLIILRTMQTFISFFGTRTRFASFCRLFVLQRWSLVPSNAFQRWAQRSSVESSAARSLGWAKKSDGITNQYVIQFASFVKAQWSDLFLLEEQRIDMNNSSSPLRKSILKIAHSSCQKKTGEKSKLCRKPNENATRWWTGTLTYRSPPVFLSFSTRTHLSCHSLHLCFCASQTDTSNSRKTFVLSINQLGSPASLAQRGFFINKGVSHVKKNTRISRF